MTGGPEQIVTGFTEVVVDAANVVGSRPDGWWRDRAGAARRLAAQLVTALEDAPARLVAAFAPGAPRVRVHLVLEGAARQADVPEHPLLVVHRAPGDGDSAIAALAAELVASHRDVVVVTADRGLRVRVGETGARVAGPGTLLDVLGTVRRPRR